MMVMFVWWVETIMEGESNTVVATALEESAIVMDYGMLQRLRLSVTSLDLKVYVIWYLIYLCVCVCVCFACLCVFMCVLPH